MVRLSVETRPLSVSQGMEEEEEEGREVKRKWTRWNERSEIRKRGLGIGFGLHTRERTKRKEIKTFREGRGRTQNKRQQVSG